MTSGLHLVQRNAIRMLENEAQTRAASIVFPSTEHDFYFGVVAAARDHLHRENLAIHSERWLSLQPAAFKEGYVKTSLLIGMAGDDPPHHLPLPTPD